MIGFPHGKKISTKNINVLYDEDNSELSFAQTLKTIYAVWHTK
jgi:hypothetical protein